MNNLKLRYERHISSQTHFPIQFMVVGQIQNTQQSFYINWHEHIELLFCLYSGSVFCGTKTYYLKRGDLIVVNPNEYHTTNEGLFYCLQINPSFFADVQFKDVLFTPYIKKDSVIIDCFKAIRKDIKHKNTGWDMSVKSIVYRLCCYLLQNYQTDILAENETDNIQSKAARVAEILNFITTNFQNSVTTAFLAEQFHMSESYFCSFFKSKTNLSPMEYINQYRIKMSQSLLKSTDNSITDIALTVGFSDPNYFSRTFKKITGFSPREFRKRQ